MRTSGTPRFGIRTDIRNPQGHSAQNEQGAHDQQSGGNPFLEFQTERELKIYAADLAVSLAEKKITVDEATDKDLVRSFTEQINPGKDGR